MTDYEQYLLGGLETHLGKSQKTSGSNYSFHCPFCNHRKPKLEVNIKTNDKGENPFACWVCGTKGRKISKLLRFLNVPKAEAIKTLQYVRKGVLEDYHEDSVSTHVELPKDYVTLWDTKSDSYVVSRAKSYLYSRGLTDEDIRKYQIGYASSGEYVDRVVIPSYSEFGKLDMFIARAIGNSHISYLKPNVNTAEVVFFDNLINWNKPIILCEGVFDAIAIKRNAVPLLGKYAQAGIKKRIIENKTPAVYIALDLDARRDAIKLGDNLIRLGVRVYIIDIEEKDPGQITTSRFKKYIETAQELDLTKLLQYKLK